MNLDNQSLILASSWFSATESLSHHFGGSRRFTNQLLPAQACRSRIYSAFEEYKKLKAQNLLWGDDACHASTIISRSRWSNARGRFKIQLGKDYNTKNLGLIIDRWALIAGLTLGPDRSGSAGACSGGASDILIPHSLRASPINQRSKWRWKYHIYIYMY